MARSLQIGGFIAIVMAGLFADRHDWGGIVVFGLIGLALEVHAAAASLTRTIEQASVMLLNAMHERAIPADGAARSQDASPEAK